METAFAVLSRDPDRSLAVVSPNAVSQPAAPASLAGTPFTAREATTGPTSAIMVRSIGRRDEIPLREQHVLVMGGLSTYRHSHALGTTFVFDNSLLKRDGGGRSQAIAEATALAQSLGLRFIYLLE